MYIYNSESALTLVSKIETLSMCMLLDKEIKMIYKITSSLPFRSTTQT